ncbi:hypothetical protein QR680_018129 [Steinernema hermaphroditum]|uniref:G-protein coupled receptors family 1 profile domain-containing protein n=1 Tax=Steinernema hermaphroditum TaxID=289476 RepID=A0AA39HHQ9_9BILA|nr:hypothetical protein QR680_018129 [Steinernema hermaphroditum]
MMLQLAVITFGIFGLGTFGIFGNLNIIFATLRSKELKSKCGILIGILGFCDLTCIVFEWQNAARLLLGVQSWRLSCFIFMTPYMFMINFQSTMILAVALDRFFAIMFPIKCRVIQTRTYILAMITPGALYGVGIVIAGYVYMIDEPIEVCNPPLGFPPNVSIAWNRITISINFAVLFVYLCAILGLKYKVKFGDGNGNGKSYYRHQQAIMKNLSVMIIFFILSWFVCHAAVLIVTLFNFGGEAMLHIAQSTAVIPAMLCYSQNFYIYFWRSDMYRSIFKKQLLRLVKCGKHSSQVYTTEGVTSKFHSPSFYSSRGTESRT